VDLQTDQAGSAEPLTAAPGPVPAGETALAGDPRPAFEPRHAARPAAASRLYILDLLRFVAAMSVLGYHVLVDNDGSWGVSASHLFTYELTYVFSYGWMGVDFFFIISGFVICMSSWGRSLSAFVTSRVTRLMPAYVFAVLFTTAVLTIWPLSNDRPGPQKVLVNLTMLEGFVNVTYIDVVYWTLFVELQFYILFCLVVYRGLTYRRVVIFALGWLLAGLFAKFSGVSALATLVDAQFAPYFVAGIVLYLIHRFGPNLLLWATLAVCVVLMTPSLQARFSEQSTAISFAVAGALLVAFVGVMVAVALGWFSWVRWRGLTTVGALTYPVYLLHRELTRGIQRHYHDALPAWTLLGLEVFGVLLLAYLVHRLVETPLSRQLKRWLKASFAQIRADRSRVDPALDKSAGLN
jgi:peptidoglycan/LPS O-acetylase OafA/YrhL